MNFQIFKNEYKKEDKHPDYKISMKMEDGTYKEVGAGWIKEMKGGKKYISCKVDTNSEPHVPPSNVSGYTDSYMGI